jgi:YegS/Rv2252/BmrU family lipid kinase
LLPTRSAGDAANRAREAEAQGADLLIVLGGDGTVNEVVNGKPRIPLAVLPGGTANCLSVELGLGKDIEHAARKLGAYEPREVAVGRVGERRFLLMCGVGLDARIVYDVSLSLKRRAGKLAYWASGFSQFTHSLDALEVEVEGRRYRAGYLLASRIKNYGGDLEIARGASLERGDFEVVLFEGTNPLRYAWYMLGVAAGRAQAMRGATTLAARSVKLLTPAHVQIDGEYLGRGPVEIDLAPEKLRLLMPRHG